jgi:hypothetical protein
MDQGLGVPESSVVGVPPASAAVPAKKPPGKLTRSLSQIEHWLHTIGGAVFIVTTISGLLALIVNGIPISQEIKNVSSETWLSVAAAFFSFGFFLSLSVSLLYHHLYKRTKYRLRNSVVTAENLKEKVEKYKAPEPIFRRWSEANASCDKLLFDALFRKKGQESVKQASDEIDKNIQETIHFASEVLSAFVGHPCAVSFQILDKDERNWYVIPQSKWRDQQSRKPRKDFDGKKTYIPTNSSYTEVIDRGKDCWCHDDLKNCHGYRNETTGWNNYFNAVAIFRVLRLDEEESHYPCLGLLIADSLHKGLANDTVTHYLSEFSDRLAVMTYRLNSLAALVKQGSV